MKIVKIIIILIILSAAAVSAVGVYNLMQNQTEHTDFQMDIANDSLCLVLDKQCVGYTPEVYINDKTIYYDTECSYYTAIEFKLDDIQQNTIFDIRIDYVNETGIADTIQINNVCVSTDGEIPLYDNIETLVLYDYPGDGFPEVRDGRLKSLYIIYTQPGNQSIELKELNKLTSLQSLFIRSNGGVYGNINRIKPLTDLRRLVIENGDAIEGEMVDLDEFFLLETLELEGTKITGELDDIIFLKNVKTLTLIDNKGMSGDYKWLKKLTDLEEFVTAGCSFKGDLGEIADSGVEVTVN